MTKQELEITLNSIETRINRYNQKDNIEEMKSDVTRLVKFARIELKTL